MKIYASIYNILIPYLLLIILLGSLFVPTVIGFYVSYVEFNVVLNPLLLIIIVTLGIVICGLFCLMILRIIQRKKGILILTDKGFYCPHLLDASNFIPWQKVGYINLLSSSYRGIITNHIEIGIDHSVELKRKRSLLNTLRLYFGKQKLYQSLILTQLTLAEFDILEIYSLLKFYHRKGFGEKFEIKATNERRGVTFFGKLGTQYTLYYEACFSWRYYSVAFLLIFLVMWGIFILAEHGGNYMRPAMFAFVLSLIVIILLEQDSKIGRLSANKLKPLAIDFDRDGIYQLNKTRFKEQVLWKDIISIEIAPKRKGTQLKPYLTIKLKKSQHQNKTFQIRNELLGTSIYELNEVMTNYWLDKGKQ